MCSPSSLPENFSTVLNEYAASGFRVIGVAYKKLDRKMKWIDAQRVKREQLECNMTFLGLLVMQNSLKPQSAPTINDLHNANIRLVMITGLLIVFDKSLLNIFKLTCIFLNIRRQYYDCCFRFS